MPTDQLASEQEINQRVHHNGWRHTLGLHALVIALWIAAYCAGYLNTMPGLGSVGVSLWYLPAGIAMGAVMALGPSAGIDIALASSIKSLAVGEPWIEQVHAIRARWPGPSPGSSAAASFENAGRSTGSETVPSSSAPHCLERSSPPAAGFS